LPFMAVAPVLVTVDPAKTANVAADLRFTGASAAVAA
jgi:hypothetical protein